jgi:hypothetical protein
MTDEEVQRELSHLATREDLALLRADTKEGLAGLRGDLHTDIARLETRMIKWMVALTIPIYVLLVGLILALVPHLK